MENSYFHDQALRAEGRQARMAEGRREALQWLAQRLEWERRLGELRHDEPVAPVAKRAA